MSHTSLLRWRFALAMLTATTSCAASTPPAKTAGAKDSVASAATSPEQICLADANVATDLPDDAPRTVTVRHILVKHVEAEGMSNDESRTRGAACLRAVEALEALKGGQEFPEAVADYSDEAGAATRDGSLGQIKVEDVAAPFAAAAFALDVAQVSHVVETKFGFHIIQRLD